MSFSDFNIGNTISNLPSLKGATDSINSGIQKASDYAIAGASKLKAEVVGMLNSKGITGKFDNLSQGLKIKPVDTRYLLIDGNTNTPVADIGNVSAVNTPASALQQTNTDRTNDLKVTLRGAPSGYNGIGDIIVLDVMPTISESRSVSYKSFTPQQHPGEILKYESTSSREWSISAKLISRTVDEATWNLNTLNTIRGWTMPFYGEGTAQNEGTASYLGAPPPIITLTAYGERMIGPIKCVVTNYSWDFPNDVDYIQADSYGENGATKVPFPVILSVTIALKESWSPAEYSGFNLRAFKEGNMAAAFTPFTARSPAMPSTTTAASTPVGPDGSDSRFARQEADALAKEVAAINDQSAARLLRQGTGGYTVPKPPIWSGQDPIAEGMSKIKATKDGWQ